MDKTKTSVMQKTPLDLEVLPFYFVKIWPRDIHPKSRIKEAVKLFEEMDQRHFQMSENIKIKLFEWEQVVSRLDDLKYSHLIVNGKVEIKKSMLINLNLELDSLCSASETCRRRTAKSACTTEQCADIHKLNFLMLHGTKRLSEENKLLRDMNFGQQKQVVATLPLYPYYEEMKNSAEGNKMATKNEGESLEPCKISKESMRTTIKAVCDELMEVRKDKKTVEAKIKSAEKRLGAIREEIRSLVKPLKDEEYRKEAFFCILDQRKVYNEECWVLQYRNLESMHSCMIYMDTSPSSWTGSCRNWRLNSTINCL